MVPPVVHAHPVLQLHVHLNHQLCTCPDLQLRMHLALWSHTVHRNLHLWVVVPKVPDWVHLLQALALGWEVGQVPAAWDHWNQALATSLVLAPKPGLKHLQKVVFWWVGTLPLRTHLK